MPREKKTVHIGGMTFTTATSLERTTRELVGRNVDQRIELDSNDGLFLMDLVQHHPETDRKLTHGVRYFVVGRNDAFNHHGGASMLLIQPITSVELIDISWKKCCTYAFRNFDPEADRQRLIIEAMRHEISGQLDAFRRKHRAQHDGGYVSDLSGQHLASGDVHVDHAGRSFADLATSWLGTVDASSIVITDRDTPGPFGMAEPHRTMWRQFHGEHATLQIVSARENLSVLPLTRGF